MIQSDNMVSGDSPPDNLPAQKSHCLAARAA